MPLDLHRDGLGSGGHLPDPGCPAADEASRVAVANVFAALVFCRGKKNERRSQAHPARYTRSRKGGKGGKGGGKCGFARE